ncbi:probable ATP-dependent DNA helicase CHR12, partial [Olea europaea var. sylvestris]|uniref:probable ATP-dependent DNA helicase CHR12 n=1 Tax=Olea europaea var. sylvestris TaxID=158386 RepID=UPI000C1D8833
MSNNFFDASLIYFRGLCYVFVNILLCFHFDTGLPTSRGEDLQSRCLLELYGLKLAELQSKVRSEVISEYWLRLWCANPDKKLFDWGMTRLRRPLYGIGDAFAMEADDSLKKKRDAERLSRSEEEERNRVETRKRKFFADLLNALRELQLQVQASQKRRKQRSDGVQILHKTQKILEGKKCYFSLFLLFYLLVYGSIL